ncbi:MAG: MTAP family purine nucleoside phosphorylase [Candidatus Thalassarchaeaceae archaeon]
MKSLVDALPDTFKMIGQESIRIDSPWGEVPTELIRFSDQDGSIHEIAIVQRHHGDGVVTPPHRIEHRANVHAVLSFEPEFVISINSVGSLREDLPPGYIGVAKHTLDFTGKVWTFHDDAAIHADMTSHFDSKLSELVISALDSSQDVVPHVVVAQMTGPQFETPAEINALKTMGADVVGMTLAAEAKLIAEKGCMHLGLSVSSNWAAGQTPGDESAEIDHHAVEGLASTVHGRLWSAIISCL